MTTSIRPAEEHELRACRLLLPPAFSGSVPATAFAALEHGRLVGAAAHGGMLHGPHPGARPVLVHVLPEWRRRGVGRALLTAIPGVLRSWLPVPEASEAAAFAAGCGFARRERIFHFETDVARFHDMMVGLKQRVVRRIPQGARIVSLRDVSPAAVADLMGREFPVGRAEVIRRMSPKAHDGYALDLSVALLVEQRLAGVLVYLWNAGVPVIEVRAVSPAFRGGWANVLLLEAATRNGLVAGAARFRFYCDETVSDTLALARRAGADTIATELQLWRDPI